MRVPLTTFCLTLAATMFAVGGAARANDAGSAISSIAVRTPTGEYWSVGGGDDGQSRIFADAPHIGTNEVFRIEAAEHERWSAGCLPNGARVELTTAIGESWFVEDRQLFVGEPTPEALGSKTVFTLINETDAGRCFRYGDRLSIISSEEYYLSASPEGRVDADQKHRGGWEIFDLVDPSNPAPAISTTP